MRPPPQSLLRARARRGDRDLGATLLYDYIAEQLAPFFYNEGLKDAQSLAGRAYTTLDEDIESTKRITSPR